jgi:uncharacterized protein
MPLRSWLVFLAVVLSLLGMIHGFIGLHLWPLLSEGTARPAMVVAFLFLGMAYVAGRALENHFPTPATILLHIGSWWLGFMAYLFLGCVLVDVLLLIHLVVPFLPVDLIRSGQWYFTSLAIVILPSLALGHLNVQFPQTRRVSLPSLLRLPLRLAVASDLHLCSLVSAGRLDRIVDQINGLQPDLILLPGDIVDEDLSQTPRGERFQKSLQKLKAPFGVFAVTGNHEWISGADAAVDWLESCGITVLRDQAVDVGPCVVAGREDAAGPRFGAGPGIPLTDILRGLDHSKPLIVLDHQPVRINEAAESGANLLLCGHTHHGQLWPFQWITQRLFPVSHGHRAFGQTHVYVSCGAGAWGPQVRTSSRSEVVLIEPAG